MIAVILHPTVVGFALIGSPKMAPCNMQPFKARILPFTKIYWHACERFPFKNHFGSLSFALTATKASVMTTITTVIITNEALTAAGIITDTSSSTQFKQKMSQTARKRYGPRRIGRMPKRRKEVGISLNNQDHLRCHIASHNSHTLCASCNIGTSGFVGNLGSTDS